MYGRDEIADRVLRANRQELAMMAMGDAYLASQDETAHFNYVMREEKTNLPLRMAAHQKLAVEFMNAHDRGAVIWPIGTAKTFTLINRSIYNLGKDPKLRGAVVSATQGQAAKVVGMVSDYILQSPRLKLVFPKLKPSPRLRDKWTQTTIVVERPPGIKDPSLVAYGMDGNIPGSRFDWIIVDDLLNRENTATKEQRDKIYDFFQSSVLSRLEPKTGRIMVSNSPWHMDDLVHRLEKQGWAVLRMDLLGNVFIQDDADRLLMGFEPWDTDLIRPSESSNDAYRLTELDPDEEEEKPLFEARYPHSEIDRLRRQYTPNEFNRLFMCRVRDNETAHCKEEWIETCKKKARERGFFSMTGAYQGSNKVFTGVDLAVSPGEEHDDTAFFTFEVLPDGHRLILDVEIGQYDGPTIVDKIFKKHAAYGSVMLIENNAAQDFIRQFCLKRDVSIPVKAHTTGRAKAHPEYGVQSLFVELQNGAWLIPNDKYGRVHKHIQQWIDACLYYSPSKHTDDVLMACYFAREQARKWGLFSGSDTADDEMKRMSGVLSVMSR